VGAGGQKGAGHMIDVICVSLNLTGAVLGLVATVQAASVAQIVGAACAYVIMLRVFGLTLL
jgi:hypothetical protein